MNLKAFGVFTIALASLLLELTLIRVFDVLWYPNMAYMIITLAVFSFGLAGVALSLYPIRATPRTWAWLSFATMLMAVATLCMLPAINNLPFDYQKLAGEQVLDTATNFLLIYLVVCIPFFLAGFTLSLVFSHYASQIRRLYFYDLVGAAIGSVILVPLISLIGTVGLLWIVAGFALLSSALFAGPVIWRVASVVIAAGLFVTPFTKDQIETFSPHMDKRSFRALQGALEASYWDPISKIDIIDYELVGRIQGRDYAFKWIAYDGGTQTSYFYRFDGDYKSIRDTMPERALRHFWERYIAVSHYLKADSDANVLVIGSAGGQEAKAALTYNAAHVDGIELVAKVVELGKTDYNDYIGGVMTDPRTNIRAGEGRSFLRSSDNQYDIIQINSNHTSSSIAAGSGAMQSHYLQTVEAYEEFFSHLSKDGILHINHHIFPKMVATAAQAWANLGRGNFRDHVLVFEAQGQLDNLPTLLIRMQPWTAGEIARTSEFLDIYDLVVNPLKPDASFLSEPFFQPDFPAELAATIPYRIMPPTDDRPFFNSMRRSLDLLPARDEKTFVNESISGLMNAQRATGFPIDIVHLVVTAGAALVFALIFTSLPLLFSSAGRARWTGKSNVLVYFSCLGAGYIILQLVFIQIFMKLIGYPLYTYTAVVFTFLFAAGLGSLLSEKLRLIERGRWWLPFIGIALSVIALIACQQLLFDAFLQFPTAARIALSIAMIFPLALFLGMPFPLGILAIQHKPDGTVAWAWAFNGLFTVIGGIFCAVFSVYFGFRMTMTVAVAIYLLALLMYRGLNRGFQMDRMKIEKNL